MQQQDHQEDKQPVVLEKLADTWTSHGKVTQNIVQNNGGPSNLVLSYKLGDDDKMWLTSPAP